MTQSTTLPEPIADAVDVAAFRMGIGRASLYREVAAGRLRVRKMGKRTLVPRAEQDRWLNSLPESGAADEAPDFSSLSVSELEAIVASSEAPR